MRYIVEQGKEYNKLTPFEKLQTPFGTFWLCRCRCGKVTKVNNSYIAKGIVKSCGGFGCRESKLRRDLTDIVFGKLTILEYIQHNPDDNNRGGWKVRCSCGTEKIIRTEHLTKGLVQSCGSVLCKEYPNGNSSTQLPKGIASRNKVVDSYKRHAKKANREFSLTNKQLDKLFQGTCHYCGTPPSNDFSSNKVSGNFVYNGIDRKNNNKGYIKGNVVSCCRVCNRAKNNMSYKDFTTYLDQIASYRYAN